jgi:hypothetical protein
MEWLATFGAFSRDRAITNGDSAVLVYWTGARAKLRNRLTAISDLDGVQRSVPQHIGHLLDRASAVDQSTRQRVA